MRPPCVSIRQTRDRNVFRTIDAYPEFDDECRVVAVRGGDGQIPFEKSERLLLLKVLGIGGKGMTQPDQIDRDLIATGDRVAVPQFQGNALARTIVNLDAVIVAGLESSSEQPGLGGRLGDELPGGFYGLVDTEL